MEPAGYVTLVAVGLTVAALAFYLIRVALLLKHVNFTLGTVIAGVRAIALATEPVNPVLGDIAKDLTATKDALEGLLAKKGAPMGAQPAPANAAAAAAPAASPSSGGVKPVLVSRLKSRRG